MENTRIIFTSYNGSVLDDGYDDKAQTLVGSYDPSGGLRGGKYSAYEAATRMATILYWKGKVQPLVSSALLSQVDFFASCRSWWGVNYKPTKRPTVMICLMSFWEKIKVVENRFYKSLIRWFKGGKLEIHRSAN